MDSIYHCSEFLGTCVKLASPWMDTVKIGVDLGLKAKNNIYENGLLTQETEFVYNLNKEFKRYIRELRKLQSQYGLEICQLEGIDYFSKSLDQLLEGYKAGMINNSMKLTFPEWYRQQLQNYTNFMNLFFTSLQSQYQFLSEKIKDIKALPKDQRSAEWELLRESLQCMIPSK
jgi:hypothetical protein